MQINPALTIEDFGNEIIIVNLHNGAYFSLKNSAAKLWCSTASAPDLPEALAALSKEFTLDETALEGIGNLLRQFREDFLVHFEDNVLEELAASRLPLPTASLHSLLLSTKNLPTCRTSCCSIPSTMSES